MKQQYIIQNLVDNGYWSSSHDDFKGILFADYYDTVRSAEFAIELILQSGRFDAVLTIVTIYSAS
jgi:hypothetical protein